MVHFLTGRRAHNIGPSPLLSPPPPRAPSLPSPTRRLASQALALTGGYPHQHAARTARPTLATPPRSCMGCARFHAQPRAAHACNRPHHDATRRRHSLHPARADLAHTHVPQEPQALGSAIVLLEVGSKRLDEAPAMRGKRGKRATRRTGRIHDDHLDVVTVAGDRTCPQPRAPSISSRRSLSRSHSLQVGARPTSRL